MPCPDFEFRSAAKMFGSGGRDYKFSSYWNKDSGSGAGVRRHDDLLAGVGARRGQAGWREHYLDFDVDRACAVYDLAGFGVVLWRAGALQEFSFGAHALFRRRLPDVGHVACVCL